ncbi:MAG: hypothetical protein IJT65_04580 [Eubacterium sp.]|nr:hypothetical protein [Eubacterium sp.]
MARSIPMIITNNNILVKKRDENTFTPFNMPGIEDIRNIPFYHQFASRIAACQNEFKEFIKELYGKKLAKNILAVITPDDTSPLERIFINEFFVNSGACKAVAQMNMGQALSKADDKYISLSMSERNIILQYISNNEVKAKHYYSTHDYDVETIIKDTKKLHIDVEYVDAPLYINNFNRNMDDFLDKGIVITPKEFLDKIVSIDVEKL